MTSFHIDNFTSANRCYFKNVTALFTYIEHWGKRVFVGFCIDGTLLAELQAGMSRSCRILLFLHHNYQVSLKWHKYSLLRFPDTPCVYKDLICFKIFIIYKSGVSTQDKKILLCLLRMPKTAFILLRVLLPFT